MMKQALLGLLSLCVAVVSQASNTAQDNASNYPGGTWNTSTNGGFGFGAWSFSTGNGTAGSYIGGTADGNPAFGLFANGGAFSNVSRSFTGGGLVLNQTFSMTLANTANVGNGAQIGLNLLSGSSTVFTFVFTGGQSFWQLNDGGSNFNTTIPFAANTPISFAFTYKGGNSYSVSITEGSNTYAPGTFTASNNLTNIDGFKVFNNGQGAGENIGFNLLSVPEPSTWVSGALALSACACLGLRRRKALERV